MMKKKAMLSIISIILLVIGLLLYLFINRDAYVSRVLIKVLPIQTAVDDSFFVRLIRSFGADFLWSASFTLIVQRIVWLENKKTFLLLLCSLLGMIFELMQLIGIAAGTADITDVGVYLLGSIFAVAIIKGGKLYEKKSDVSVGNGH